MTSKFISRAMEESQLLRYGKGRVVSQYVWAAMAEYHKPVAHKQQEFISHSARGSLRSRCQQMQCLMRALFLVHKWPSFCCVFTWHKGQGSSLRPLIEGLQSHSLANHLPEAPSQNTNTLRIKIQYRNFQEVQTFSPQKVGFWFRFKCIKFKT